MNKYLLIALLLLHAIVFYAMDSTFVGDMDVDYATILQEIFDQVSEDNSISFEEIEETLEQLHENPINLNQTSWDELHQIPFLSDEQINAILLYVSRNPLHELFELQLIPTLKPYDIRNLLPFVYVGEAKSQKQKTTFKDVLKYSKHDLIARADARNLESYKEDDPFYANFRYKYNLRNQVSFGFQYRRNVGEDWKKGLYGGYLQINDVWKLKRIVAGNFQASFGQGLVLSNTFHYGKANYFHSCQSNDEGLKKFGAVGDYDNLHGIGTTLRLGSMDVSVLYSNKKDKMRHQIVGGNVTYRFSTWKVGITSVYTMHEDYFAPSRKNYYNWNYFRGEKQAVVGANFYGNLHRCIVFGEAAATQNRKWGYGGIVGTRFSLVSDVTLLALYRYYSSYFDNVLGHSFSENSRLGDENGFYIGSEIKSLRKWKFMIYADGFRFGIPKYGIRDYPTYGYDVMTQADFYVKYGMNMFLKLRSRLKGDKFTESVRYQFNYKVLSWRFRTQFDANWIHDKTNSPVTYGLSALQDVDYHFSAVPIVLQARLQIFDVMNWDNRIYNYENDVLYAFSIPATYGYGGRWYLNARYQICKWCSVYLRGSQTIYADKWMKEKKVERSKTDLHLLVRFSI